MNIPLIRNDPFPNLGSASPSGRANNKLTRERSPPPNALLSFNETILKNQISGGLPIPQPQKLPPLDPESFRVYVRVRPLNNKEVSTSTSKRASTVEVRDNLVFVFDPDSNLELPNKKEKIFAFDNVYDQTHQTENIYKDTLTPALQNMVQGFNSTILAYGMTGAGKTFTMFGDIYNSEGGIRLYPGMVNLIVRDIFQSFEMESENYEFILKMSYIEIYNEQIRDLLNSATENLMVVEDPAKGILIPNLLEFAITSEQELLKLILTGNSRRVMASTHANQFSSRSHAIIQLFVEKRNRVRDINETYTQSKLCFVDLAGSERAATTENRGLRLMEGANINRSLLALGNCINVLSDSNKRGAFVPYRDSKLTRLLKDSLGGNTRTIMLACISPASIAYEETTNTLSYASRARKIKKKVVSNKKEVELHVSQYKEIIGSLRNEIDLLKNQLMSRNQSTMMFKEVETSQDPYNLAKEIEGGSLDSLGKMLFANLEENWEIRQSLKELRELKGQNEAALGGKKEEQEKAKVENGELYEAIEKEIASLNEVMVNNEKIEAEMETNLEKNMKEKKQIEEKILLASSQGIKQTEGMERRLTSASPEKNVVWNEELIGLHMEKAEKDCKIHLLEKEIDKMRRELAEKDKLLAQNQQGSKAPTQQQQQQQQQQSLMNKLSKPLYNYKGLSGQGGYMSRKAMGPGYGFGANRDLMRELQNKKKENEGSLQDLDAQQPVVRKEENRLIRELEEELAGERARERQKMFSGSMKLQNEHSENRRNNRHFKGTGLNDYGAKTAANAIRQKVKNKYNQASQPVSLNELKDYAEKLKKLNFEAVQKKTKKRAGRGYASPDQNQNPYMYSQLANQHDSSQPEFVFQSMHLGSIKGFMQTSQNAPKEALQPKADKSPINNSPSRDFSEISSIVMQPNEQSVDQSVDDLLGNTEEGRARKSAKNQQHQQQQQQNDYQTNLLSSPTFHLNIKYLMGQTQFLKSSANKEEKQPPQSMERSGHRRKEAGHAKGPRSVNNIDEAGDYLLPQAVGANLQTTSLAQARQNAAQQQRLKHANPSTLVNREENPQQQTLYYLNFKREEVRRQDPEGENNSVSLKSQTIDNEGLVSELQKVEAQMKHLRSTSLHPEDRVPAKKSEDEEDDVNKQSRGHEVETVKKNANDIRSLDAVRGAIRAFRGKLLHWRNIVESNSTLDENSVREISGLIKDYNENQYLLPPKDYEILAQLEAAVKSSPSKEGRKSLNQEQQQVPMDLNLKAPRSVSVNMTKYISTSIKDLEGKLEDSAKKQPLKKSIDLVNDSVSSGRGSNHDDKTTASSSIGKIKEQSLLYSKGKGAWGASAGKISVHGSNTINIYNQFAGQNLRHIQSNKEDSKSNKAEEWFNMKNFQRENPDSEGKKKTNPEVQNLIDKQKRHLEEMEKHKKETGVRTVALGLMDAYYTTRTSYDGKQEEADRDPRKVTSETNLD